MSENLERKDGETSLGEHLRKVVGDIIADGRVDFDETPRILDILKPLGEFDAKAVELRKAVEEVRSDGVVTAEESAKLVALIKDFMAEAAHWSLATCPACKRTVPVSSLQGATRRCSACGAEIPRGGTVPRSLSSRRSSATQRAMVRWRREYWGIERLFDFSL